MPDPGGGECRALDTSGAWHPAEVVNTSPHVLGTPGGPVTPSWQGRGHQGQGKLVGLTSHLALGPEEPRWSWVWGGLLLGWPT